MLLIGLGIFALIWSVCWLLCPFFIGFSVLSVPREYRVSRNDCFRQVYVTDMAGLMFVVALFMAPYRTLTSDGTYTLVAMLIPSALWYGCYVSLRDAGVRNATQRVFYCTVAMPVTWASSFSLLFLVFGWMSQLRWNYSLIPMATLLCANLCLLVVTRRYVRWLFRTHGAISSMATDSVPVAELV